MVSICRPWAGKARSSRPTTYFGQQENPQPSHKRRGRPFTKGGRSGPSGKRMVIALVERGGNIRSFHPARADGDSVNAIVRQNIARESRLHTDESRLYIGVGREFAAHETTTHSHGEYVRGDVHTNSVEGFFSIFKRGMRGVYQHCKEKHLHRYLAEFDFRYISRTIADMERTVAAVRGGEGKRLTSNSLSRIGNFRRRVSCVGGASAAEAFCASMSETRRIVSGYPLAA